MGTEIEVEEIQTVPISTSATPSKKHFEWTPARKEAFEKCILARNEALRKRKEAEKDGIELPPKPKKSSSKNKSATVVSSLPPPPPTPTPLPSAPVLPPIGTVKKEDPLKKNSKLRKQIREEMEKVFRKVKQTPISSKKKRQRVEESSEDDSSSSESELDEESEESVSSEDSSSCSDEET